jgi:hypothetical protein
VYVSSFAPAGGQSTNDLLAGQATPPWVMTPKLDESGFLTLPETSVAQYLAQDLSKSEVALLAVIQGPWFHGCLADRVGTPAW